MSSAADIWDRVPPLIDRAPSLDALRAHRLQLFAASQWRADGRPVPDELRAEELEAAVLALAAPLLLRRARDAYDGRLVLMKGPEVAARYPRPQDRLFRDLDLLAEDPSAAQRALIATGFVEAADPADYAHLHHGSPLVYPGVPLRVEIHRGPQVPAWLETPPVADVFASAVPSATGIDGLLAPSPATHAVLLAAHAWAHRPLGRLADLVDIAAILDEADRAAAATQAARWGAGRMWRRTLTVTDALLGGARRPAALRTWARYLEQTRDISLMESHILRIAGPAAAAPPHRLPAAFAGEALQTFRPWNGESWSEKLARSRGVVFRPSSDKVEHDRALGHNPWAR